MGPPTCRSASEGIWAVSGGIELPCEYALQCKERPLTCKNSATTITSTDVKVTVKTKLKYNVHVVVLLYI